MTTTHITPEHKTLVVALHAGVTHSKLFDENAKTHALVHPAGSVSWRSSACTRKSVLDRGFVSVKCRVYALKPRYTVTAVINGTRCAAHVDRLGGHFMQIQESVYWFASKNASKSWQERGCAMIAPEQVEDRGVTVRVQADAVLARLAPVTTEPATPVTTEPAAPVTTEPAAPAPVTEAPAAPAPLAPVTLGASPAGVEWVVYPKSTETAAQFHARVQVGRERLAALNAKQVPASLAPVTVGLWDELTLYPRAGESAAVFHARVEQEHARLTGVTPAKEPTLHRDALAHLQGLDEVTYDYLVDAYAEAVDRELSRTPPREWTEERAEECLDCSALEDQDWHPPRTCDTWQEVYALIREAYERAAE